MCNVWCMGAFVCVYLRMWVCAWDMGVSVCGGYGCVWVGYGCVCVGGYGCVCVGGYGCVWVGMGVSVWVGMGVSVWVGMCICVRGIWVCLCGWVWVCVCMFCFFTDSRWSNYSAVCVYIVFHVVCVCACFVTNGRS